MSSLLGVPLILLMKQSRQYEMALIILELVHVIQAPQNSSKSLLQKHSFGMFLKRYDYRSLPLVALHLTTLIGLFIWE